MSVIKEAEAGIARLEEDLRKANRTISGLEADFKVIDDKRSPRHLRNNAFKRHREEFMQGWFTYLAQAFPAESTARQNEARTVCDATVTLLTQ